MTAPRPVVLVSFILALLTAPLPADAQQAARVPRIGWLGGPTRESAEPFVQGFLRGLKDLGWIEGQTIVIEWRFAGGRAERLPDLAAELVRLQVDLIVVPSTPPALAARSATKMIPIVTVAVGDPVGLGLVANKEAVPTASRVGVLWNPATPGNAAPARSSSSGMSCSLRTEDVWQTSRQGTACQQCTG